MIACGRLHLSGAEFAACARRLGRDESGQDQVEYALLTAVVVFAGLAGFDAIRAALGVAYTTWMGAINGLWESPAPGAAGS
jgi:Flp pilus assembly pilin Flp